MCRVNRSTACPEMVSAQILAYATPDGHVAPVENSLSHCMKSAMLA